ncbi:PrkA family serine protein kinase [Candidatus Kaiserbacteria bacterium]|nr:PrkA family serine protein kinase [Candidatus Kaiserbacteria bacterium]
MQMNTTAPAPQSIFEAFARSYEAHKEVEMSLQEYLDGCKRDPMMYATIHERLLKAIGDPQIIDTSKDRRLGQIFGNRTIRTYKKFAHFYGMEEVIERLMSFLLHAEQGVEERKQILYLKGPVGSGKSSLAECIKDLVEAYPIYVLKARNTSTKTDELSPVFESPLGLFARSSSMGAILEEKCGIERRHLPSTLSPWALKRLIDFGGDISRFRVVKLYPSRLRQIGIAKTEPGDENNQDISSLVGKVNVRLLEDYAQSDPDAYSYSGALNRANQGVMEFVEMFKAPIKSLNPLLTATQEGNYIGTENIGAIPFSGMILAHSNETEWQAFKNNRANEALLARVFVIDVPFCLRVSEEKKIYEKLIRESALAKRPCAPATYEILARFTVLSRLKPHENSTLWAKMRVYDGESLKDKDPNSKSIHEYRSVAGINEGMSGVDTRFAFKALAAAFNYDKSEIAADPVHLFRVLEDAIMREQWPEEFQKRLLELIKKELPGRYADEIGHEIQTTYLESYREYGQNLFDRYIDYADAWIEDQDFKNPDTGQLLDKDKLDTELSKMEKPAGIANPKDFRNEIVKYCLRMRAKNDGRNPKWDSYEKMRDVIEKRMFSNAEDLLPVISFGVKKDAETQKKHNEFVRRMLERGYTERQVQRLVEWWMTKKHSS